jgi:hypothetical protein
MSLDTTKLDVAVSTRLASASYTAPPTVGQIRTEIETNGGKLDETYDKAVAYLDAKVSDKLNTSGYTVPPTTTQIVTAMDATSTKLESINSNAILIPGAL